MKNFTLYDKLNAEAVYSRLKVTVDQIWSVISAVTIFFDAEIEAQQNVCIPVTGRLISLSNKFKSLNLTDSIDSDPVEILERFIDEYEDDTETISAVLKLKDLLDMCKELKNKVREILVVFEAIRNQEIKYKIFEIISDIVTEVEIAIKKSVSKAILLEYGDETDEDISGNDVE